MNVTNLSHDPMSFWNDGELKRRILTFVQCVVDQNGPDYVPPAARIAVFDNDGTLWCEQPIYIQLAFALDRVKQLAGEHPEWRTTQPFQAVLEDDHEGLAAAGMKGILALVAATHAGMTTEEFERIAREWFATGKHPRFNALFTELAYQPMVELLSHLRSNEFKTFIVSGGGIEFMRVIARCDRPAARGAQPFGSVAAKLRLRSWVGRPWRSPTSSASTGQRGEPGSAAT